MKLSYRLASMRIKYPGGFAGIIDPQSWDRLSCAIGMEIRTAIKLEASNVAKYFAESPTYEWDFAKDIPNWVPPFGTMFLEFDNPKYWNIQGDIVKEDKNMQVGFLSDTLDLKTTNRTPEEEAAVIFDAYGIPQKMDQSGLKRLSETIAGSRFLTVSQPFFAVGGALGGIPYWYGFWIVLAIAEDGKLMRHTYIGPYVERVFESMGMKETQSVMHTLLGIYGLAISFTHCKNVEMRETEESNGRQFHKRSGVPVFKYKTLHIEPMKKTLRTDGGLADSGLSKALHICRGHFATYTEERPLFGHFVGTVWKPQHVRGNAKCGIIDKDYTSNPPIPQSE